MTLSTKIAELAEHIGDAFAGVSSELDTKIDTATGLLNLAQNAAADAVVYAAEEVEASARDKAPADKAAALSKWQSGAPYVFSRIDRVQPDFGGAVGDGDVVNAADNLAALLACAQYCVTEGKVMLMPRGSEYAITSQLDWSTASGLVIEASGSSISYYGTETGTQAKIITGDITADELSVHLPTGQEVRRLLALRGKTSVGVLQATSIDQINNRTATSDAAIVADYRADEILIGKLKASNFDNVLSLQGYSNVEAARVVRSVIQDFHIESFVRGMHFDECLESVVSGGYGEGNSPNSSMTPGHNMILSEGTQRLKLSDISGVDCGEHTFRVGTSGQSLVCDEVLWSNLYSRGSGGSGGKINDNAFVELVKVNDFTAIDCGADGTDLSNSMGLFLEKANRALINGLHVSAKDNIYGAYRGLSMNSVRSKTIDGFSINKTQDSGIFDKADDGVTDDTLMTSGVVWETLGHGIEIQFGSGRARNYHIGSGVIVSQYDQSNSGTYFGIEWTATFNATESCSISAIVEDRGPNAAGTVNVTGNGSNKVNNFATVMN